MEKAVGIEKFGGVFLIEFAWRLERDELSFDACMYVVLFILLHLG
jgi:hypothetical protein